MPQCSALNCRNKGVHIFPKNLNRRRKWENALRINNFKASETARLCAAHFREDDYFGKSRYTDKEPLAKFLKKSAVPSIFCFTTTSKSTVNITESVSDFVPVVGQEEEICMVTKDNIVPAPISYIMPECSSKSIQVDHNICMVQ